ncbi:MAG TPA: dTDP-4-dehydrorhamnose reductase [Acidobacteriaceae bacterium]|jgi:dTDP-4-dehydrorhamnose reductase|nr:dTDP-4-dehydrorhamnose reductase [Acidobacteriaceae bacterium]
MRLLLFGGNGQVGRALQGCGTLGNELTVATRQDCDLTDAESVRLLVRRVRPEAIVNAAAYTAVDKAESDRESCFAVNAFAPRAMAEEAAALGAKLVHYSTDYVFDGTKATPYVEEDATGPRNVYGASKLAGEEGIAQAGGAFIILRTSWVYSNHGANFLKTMLRLRTERPELRIVADQHGAPTSADAIATATVRILTDAGAEKWRSGVYHMTAGGATSWYGFAKAIFARAGAPTPSLVPIETAEYPTPAARPANSVLSNEKFAAHFGFRLPEWEQQLDAVMAARAAANEPEIHAGT